MAQQLLRLTVPDPRICGRCHGMNWLYMPAPEIKFLNSRLVKCDRIDRHVEVIWTKDGEEIELGPVIKAENRQEERA